MTGHLQHYWKPRQLPGITNTIWTSPYQAEIALVSLCHHVHLNLKLLVHFVAGEDL